MPAERLPYPVILGRFIPGKKVVWSMKVTDEHGTVLQLTQETEDGPATTTTNGSSNKTPPVDDQVRRYGTSKDGSQPPTEQETHFLQASSPSEQERAESVQLKTKKSRRKNKFIRDQKVIKKQQTVDKTGDMGTEVSVGETSSQVLEGNSIDTLLSPSGKKICPSKMKQIIKPDEVQDMTVPARGKEDNIPVLAAVETRAQRRKRLEREQQDEEATVASGVVLSTPTYQTKKTKQKTGETLSTGDTPAATATEDDGEEVATDSNAQIYSVARGVDEQQPKSILNGDTTGDAGTSLDLAASKDNHGMQRSPSQLAARRHNQLKTSRQRKSRTTTSLFECETCQKSRL